jgi:copper chaperone CopZ
VTGGARRIAPAAGRPPSIPLGGINWERRTPEAPGARASAPTRSALPVPTEHEEKHVNTTYTVTGMSCGHCESAVTQEVERLDGVRVVSVDSGSGLLTVASEQPVDDERVRAAVDEAGYELVGRAAS